MGLQDRVRQIPEQVVEQSARTAVGWKSLDVTARFPRVGVPIYLLYRFLGSDGQK